MRRRSQSLLAGAGGTMLGMVAMRSCIHDPAIQRANNPSEPSLLMPAYYEFETGNRRNRDVHQCSLYVFSMGDRCSSLAVLYT